MIDRSCAVYSTIISKSFSCLFSDTGSVYFEAIEQRNGDGGCGLIDLISKLHKVENYHNLLVPYTDLGRL